LGQGKEMRRLRSQKSEVRSQISRIAICSLFSVLCFLFSECYAQPIVSNTLIEQAKDYDGKTVIFQGEAIGEVMHRGNFAWVNINDGANALGIWLVKELTKEINYLGSYKAKGDILEIEGVFHRACPEHGGDMDIHAQAVKKIQAGQAISEQLDTNKRNIALALAGVLCLIVILQILKKK
jgi:hypothetical protein